MKVGLINRYRIKADLEDYIRIPFKSKNTRRKARRNAKVKQLKRFYRDHKED